MFFYTHKKQDFRKNTFIAVGDCRKTTSLFKNIYESNEYNHSLKLPKVTL